MKSSLAWNSDVSWPRMFRYRPGPVNPHRSMAMATDGCTRSSSSTAKASLALASVMGKSTMSSGAA